MTAPAFEHFTSQDGHTRLAIHPTRKLKTVVLKVYFATDLDEDVTRRALLPMILRRGTRNFPSMQTLNRHLEELYGATLSCGVTKVGEWHVVKFHFEVVNDRFLPRREGLFTHGVGFLRELISDPLQVDGGFHGEFLEQEKNNLKRAIESLVDDKSAYANFRCIEEMCREEPFRLNEQGRVEDLPGIGARDLAEYHRRWADAVPLFVYATGDLDVADTRGQLETAFGAGRSGGTALSPVPPSIACGEPREVRERMDVNQAKVVMGFRHGISYRDDEYEALLLANGVLGAFSHSKLFQNVREKSSLAYYANSWLERTKGLLFIGSGIAAENYDKAVEIILEQVEAMKRGDFADETVDATVQTIINHNLMLEDNLANLAEVDFTWGLHGKPLDLAAFRKKLASVSRDEIVAVANRLKLDTTYFLHN